MHEHPQDDPELLSEIEKLGYDPRDVDVEKTPWHAIYLYVGVGFSIFLAWFVMWVIDRSQVTVTEPAKLARDRLPEPPYPLLQSNATVKKDIEDLRAIERVKTEFAGWVDEEAGVARIPVETAIDLMLEQGFESRNATSDDETTEPEE